MLKCILTLEDTVAKKRRSSYVAQVSMYDGCATSKAPPRARILVSGKAVVFRSESRVIVVHSVVVSIDNPVAEDSHEEDVLNDRPPTISIQQAIQTLEESDTHFDTNAGIFSEAEITFMQGLTSKTESLRAIRQV